jgi:phosphoketolase
MNTNNDMMYEYLMQMGAMRPEEEQMLRQQAQVDALRQQSMEPMRGQMAGRVYVAPGIGEAIAKMGTGYMAGQQQKGVDASMTDMNTRRAEELRKMRERMMQRRNPAAAGAPAHMLPEIPGALDSGGTPY